MEGYCEDCGVFRKHLHKHHLKLRSHGGTDLDGIVRLCASCHEDRHGGCFTNEVTAEFRAFQKERMQELWRDPAFRKRMLEKFSKRPDVCHGPAAQAKRAASMKELWSDPEYRAKQQKSRRAAWDRMSAEKRSQRLKPMHEAQTPEMLSAANRKNWQDPEYRARMRKAHSIGARKMWERRRGIAPEAKN